MYTWAAIVALLTIFAGFAPTYYLKGAFGTPELTGFKHVHGVVMTAWFVFFLVQVRLVATGRTLIHRRLGVAGVLLAALVVGVGVPLGIAAARAGLAPAGLPPLVFLVLPLGDMATFAILVTAAIALRKRSDWHKRLMLLATLTMLLPAVARLPVVTDGGVLVFFGLVDLLIVACIAYDTVKNRRLHPAFGFGLVFVVVAQFGRLALSQTAAWMGFAKWLVS